MSLDNIRTFLLYANIISILLGLLIIVPLIVSGYKIEKEKEKTKKSKALK